MPCRAWIIVVIVMPSITERDQGNDKVVPAIIRVAVAPATAMMTYRICRPDRVAYGDFADDCTPNDKLKTTGWCFYKHKPQRLSQTVQQQRVTEICNVEIT